MGLILGIGAVIIVGIILLIVILPLMIVLGSYLLAFALFIGLIYLCFTKPLIGIPLFILLVIIGNSGDLKEKFKIRRWLNKKTSKITEGQFEDLVMDKISSLVESDRNSEDYKFFIDNIPYGRANAFLNYFDKNIQDEDVYYYSPKVSSVRSEIREYGLLITNKGVYISKENENDLFIPFGNLYEVSLFDGKLFYKLVDRANKSLSYKSLSINQISVELTELKSFLEFIISKELNHKIDKDRIISQMDILDEVGNAENRSIGRLKINATQDQIANISVASSLPLYEQQFNEIKNYMNGSRGSGYAAEYGNNTVDKVLGKDVMNAGQILDDSGRQFKHGADRIVDGIEIQTKYYKTASESIGAAFENKQALYLKSDGSGSMMQIEVPKDQYYEAVKLMQKRIDTNQVPNVKPGEDAHNYVRKGHFTYAQAFNIAQSGTIESLVVDSMNGVVYSTMASGISATIVFAMVIWNGKSLKEAANASLYAGIKTLGKGAFVYTLTMQLSRDKIANPLIKTYTKDGIYKGFASFNNPIFELSENIAGSIRNSSLAGTSFGTTLGLHNVTGKAVVANSLTTIIVFGPDLCKALSGRISGAQLFKNSVVGAAGIGGAVVGRTVGQMLIPIPIVGAIVGGAVASYVAKATLDKYIENDSLKMFQILKEEFLDVSMQAGLTKGEFDEVVDLTIANPNLSRLLEDMYQSQTYREFAREAIMIPVVTATLSKRSVVAESMIAEGYVEVISDSIVHEQVA